MQTQRTVAGRLSRRLWRRSGAAEPSSVSSDAGWENRLAAAEAKIEHLERALEGLQDSVYRHEVLVGKDVDELHKRTEPGQMARDLSQDARRRGL